MPKYARKRKLINSSLQLKITGTLVTLAAMAALFQVFLFNRSLIGIAREVNDIDGVILSSLPRVLQANLILTLTVLVPVMVWCGILLTHKIAGPAYRMEQHLLAIARGEDASKPCRIREGDELRALCDALNAAVETLVDARDAEAVGAKTVVSEQPASALPFEVTEATKEEAQEEQAS